MRTLELDVAVGTVAEYARDAERETLIFTSQGKPVAALISLEDTDLETASLGTNPRFLALIERSRARQDAEGGVSGEEMRRRLGLS